MQKITPCLWFDGKAEEAVDFYTSIFSNSKIKHVARYGEAGYEHHQQPAGSVMIIEFELNGIGFTALNGGPQFKFNEAVSMQVNCESQQEIDHFWHKLSAGGDPNAQQCGWLKDKYGLSWQIESTEVIDMLKDPDYRKSQAVMQAVMHMKKIDIAALRQAYQQA